MSCNISIDHNSCIRDGACVKDCPRGYFTEKKTVYQSKRRFIECIKCGHCAVCRQCHNCRRLDVGTLACSGKINQL